MRNLREYFNSKQGKVVAWCIIALVAILAITSVLLWRHNTKLKTNMTNEIDTNVEQPVNEVQRKEPQIEYDGVLSSDSYTIENGSISFANDLKIDSFCFSTNENGPTKEDKWYGNYGRNETKLREDMDLSTQKVYVYYRAVDMEGTIIDPGYLMKEAEGSDWEILGMFSHDIYTAGRTDITAIHILNTLSDAPEDAWPVSAAYVNGDTTDESVMAWITEEYNDETGTIYELYIGAEGGVKVSNASYLFYYYSSCTNIYGLENLDTSHCTNMSNMFGECSVTNLDLSSFNTSNVTDMSSMFYGCSYLTSLDLSSFNTSNVTDMSSMFNCTGLVDIDLSSFNTSNVVTMESMFAESEEIKSINLSSFDTSSVTNMENMFMKYGGSNSYSILLGPNFVKLTDWMFPYTYDGYEISIISLRPVSDSSQMIETGDYNIDGEATYLYVLDERAKEIYDENGIYSSGITEVRPILSLNGESPVEVTRGDTYVDVGIKVGGLTMNASGEYAYGFQVSTSYKVGNGNLIPGTPSIISEDNYTIVYTLSRNGVQFGTVERKVQIYKPKLVSYSNRKDFWQKRRFYITNK